MKTKDSNHWKQMSAEQRVQTARCEGRLILYAVAVDHIYFEKIRAFLTERELKIVESVRRLSPEQIRQYVSQGRHSPSKAALDTNLAVIEERVRQSDQLRQRIEDELYFESPAFMEDQLAIARQEQEQRAVRRSVPPYCPFATLKAAYAAGYVDRRHYHYGWEHELEMKGHTLVLNPKEAMSRTAWKRKPRHGEKPHCLRSNGYGWYECWREDQLE